MPLPPGQTAQAPLELFGGLDTEIAAPDCPNGISPSCSDVEFTPGSVQSRRALRRLYALRPNTTVVSLGQFQKPDGGKQNLVMFSDGTVWYEDVEASPGTLTQIASLTAKSRFKMVNAFNRAYMAFSDGKVGTDVPRQWDGTNFDRLSQCGPGAAPSCADYSSSASLTGIAANSFSISSATFAVSSSGDSATATITTGSAHGFSVGQQVTIAGSIRSLLLGQWIIQTVPTTTSFTVIVPIGFITIKAINRISNVEEVASFVPHNLIVGDTVSVQGTADQTLSGSFTVASIPSIYQWTCSNSGTDTSPAPGTGAAFIPTALASSSGGIVAATATATFTAIPANTNVGDPVQINNSAAADSTYPFDNSTAGNPQFWTVLSSTSTTITFSLAGWAVTSGDTSTTGGKATIAGLSSSGLYQCVVFFQTRNGYLTKPSAPVTFASLGNQKVQVTDLPLGPDNVVARCLAFTGAGGSDFFYIPQEVQLPAPTGGSNQIVISPTVVNDNTSTSVILDFSDNALLSATGIGTPGNDLFEQVALGPAIGVSAYASRLCAWGDPNLLQNLLNMGFDGGYATSNVPSGWTVATTGGALASVGVPFGFGWQITGDGTTAAKGQITQGAYQDWEGVAILSGNTDYTFQAWVSSTGTAGDLYADIYSATSGTLATATLALSSVTSTGKFYTADFSASTPATIPSDCVLRVYAKNQANGDKVIVDEMGVYPTAEPQNPLLRFSYAENPEAFDAVTGLLGSTQDPTAVKTVSDIRGTLFVHTQAGMFETNDSARVEPNGWPTAQTSPTVNALSPWAVDAGMWGQGSAGEQWEFIAARDGLYIHWGAQPVKVSQEIQTIWETISWDYAETVWVQNDTANRRVCVGLPTAGSQTCNTVLTLDFRELSTAQQIADSPPVHISFTGKMIASDLTRKWSPWALTLNCGALLALDLNQSAVCFGGGDGKPFGSTGYGGAYRLGPFNSTDDDYGQINAYYWTYGFVSREEEQELGVGGFLKLYPFATAYATGVGSLTLTPATDSISNTWPAPPAWPLSAAQTSDFQFGLNVSGERCFFKISSTPASGETDNGFLLQKLVVGMRPSPTAAYPTAA